MNNDVTPYKCRSLDVIRKAYDAGFWITREEEAILLRFRANVRAPHTAAMKKKGKR